MSNRAVRYQPNVEEWNEYLSAGKPGPRARRPRAVPAPPPAAGRRDELGELRASFVAWLEKTEDPLGAGVWLGKLVREIEERPGWERLGRLVAATRPQRVLLRRYVVQRGRRALARWLSRPL